MKTSSLCTFAVVFFATGLLYAQRIQIFGLSRTVYGSAGSAAQTISGTNFGQFQESLTVAADGYADLCCQTSDVEVSGDCVWATGQGNSSGAYPYASGGSGLRFSFSIRTAYTYFICGNLYDPSGGSYGSEIGLFNPYGGPVAAVTSTASFSANGVIPVPAPGNTNFSFDAFTQGYNLNQYDNVVLSLYPVIGGSVPPPSPILAGSAEAMSVLWPRAVTNLILEVTTNLASAAWVADTNLVGTSGAFFAVPVDLTLPRQFFRLRMQ